MNWKEYAQTVNLTLEECNDIEVGIGRTPSVTEVEIFAVMWSEHCSYKSSKFYLKKLPTSSKIDKDRVVCGPGENAGAVSIGDGQVAVFKIESHNHPSFINPEQGSSTGVGGILRDVFTMGARPIALMNGICFDQLDNQKSKELLRGVAEGIAGYGNCIGIPTVGGMTYFCPCYKKNILVNAMAVGVAEKLFYAGVESPGNILVYAGNATGRDGVHGASMSSGSFTDEAQGIQKTVQVADPFIGKAMMESCLELLETGIVVGLQDMGAAGITCSSVEMASKGKCGLELNLDNVPVRSSHLTPAEILLSESQERMLFAIDPKDLHIAEKVFQKWQMHYGVIGEIVEGDHFKVFSKGEMLVDLPISILTESLPEYELPVDIKTKANPVHISSSLDGSLESTLVTLMSSHNLCGKRWIYGQYDHTIRSNTVQWPNSSASVVRIDGKDKAIATSVDCIIRYCDADAYSGAVASIAKCWRNIVSVGAKPLAISNCLNFGSSKDPQVMGEFSRTIDGMIEACNALDFPVISGNVSLNNATEGKNICPTPMIAGLGLMEGLSRNKRNGFLKDGNKILLLGNSKGHLSRSVYAMTVLQEEGGGAPETDLDLEKKVGEFVLANNDKITSCFALADGGLLVAMVKMCLNSNLMSASLCDGDDRSVSPVGKLGANIAITKDLLNLGLANILFGEDSGRYLIECENPDELIEKAKALSIDCTVLGEVSKEFELVVSGLDSENMHQEERINMEKILYAYEMELRKHMEIGLN